MRTILALVAGASLTLGVLGAGLAQPKAPPAPKEIKCDVCGGKMSLTDHKTATNTQEVKINGKSYYCCAGCDMSKVADKPAAGARNRAMMAVACSHSRASFFSCRRPAAVRR